MSRNTIKITENPNAFWIISELKFVKWLQKCKNSPGFIRFSQQPPPFLLPSNYFSHCLILFLINPFSQPLIINSCHLEKNNSPLSGINPLFFLINPFFYKYFLPLERKRKRVFRPPRPTTAAAQHGHGHGQHWPTRPTRSRLTRPCAPEPLKVWGS